MKLVLLSALLYAAGAIQPATSLPTYDATFTLEPGTYSGTTTFVVDGQGAVTGTMKLTDPTVVDASLAGTVKDGTWTFEYQYLIPEQGCGGWVRGTGTVSADRATVKGNAVIGGACIETPTDASFVFSRRNDG